VHFIALVSAVSSAVPNRQPAGKSAWLHRDAAAVAGRYSVTDGHCTPRISPVIVMRPWAVSSGDRNWYCASSVVTPAGTVTWKACTCTGSRTQPIGLPLPVNASPASWVSGPLGP
jgi:hypothetical protein